MQTTIYYRERDEYLIEKLGQKANRERKSKSAVVLTILEEYFEAERTPAEILYDKELISKDKLKGNRDLETVKELKEEFEDVPKNEIETAVRTSQLTS